jgi:DNA-binding MarR family transcriptional regulator
MKDNLSKEQLWELWWIILHTRNAMNKARRKETSQIGVEEEQAATLVVMRSIGEKATPAEIARWLAREPHSVSSLITRMEKNGLVKKIRNLDKKNLVRVIMTKKGEEKYDLIIKREIIYEIMSVLSEEQYNILISAMHQLWDKAIELTTSKGYKAPIPSNGLGNEMPEKATLGVRKG